MLDFSISILSTLARANDEFGQSTSGVTPSMNLILTPYPYVQVCPAYFSKFYRIKGLVIIFSPFFFFFFFVRGGCLQLIIRSKSKYDELFAVYSLTSLSFTQLFQ
jgi:hypothetical protein